MKSLWSEAEAAQYRTPLGLRVYSSRLLGRDRTLVLHGGGNTSVKLAQRNVLGEEEQILFVKGSGWDLEAIDEPGFAPVRLEHLVRLASLDRLSDPEMMNELNTHRLRASAPSPSVEAILHAILPYRYVDHTHADAVLAITNTAEGARRIAEVYGADAVIVPYVMPGFDLARLCAREFPRQRNAGTTGMVLMNHGIFAFGDTARESYERMIALVDRAERYLKRRKAWSLPAARTKAPATPLREAIARLRQDVSAHAGHAMVLRTSQDVFHESGVTTGELIIASDATFTFSENSTNTTDGGIRMPRALAPAWASSTRENADIVLANKKELRIGRTKRSFRHFG